MHACDTFAVLTFKVSTANVSHDSDTLVSHYGCEVLWWVCLPVCLSVCPRGYLQKHTCDLYQTFLRMLRLLPMSVARCSSGMLTIGRIDYRRKGGDGSAQRWQSVIYDCLVDWWAKRISQSLNQTNWIYILRRLLTYLLSNLYSRSNLKCFQKSIY